MDLKGKKVLVTGGAGFLGGHVIQALRSRGVPDADIFVPRSEVCDLRFLRNCEEAVRGRDVVIHLAGITGGIEFHKKNPAKIFYDNLMMGIQLMEAGRKAGAQKFVTIGSATEYPEGAPLPFKEQDLWMGFPERIHAPYTIAKKMLSVQAEAYRRQYGSSAIHLLMTNMYGPGQALQNDMVIPSVIRRIWKALHEGQSVLEVWGTGRPTRDFLYAKDAAQGILLATEQYDKSEPVNIASGWEISIRELTALIARLMNFQGEITFNTSKPDGQMRRVLDTSRAEREFGFRATTDFETGLRETIDWYRALIAQAGAKKL